MSTESTTNIPAREIPIPDFLSPMAQAVFQVPPVSVGDYPDLADKAGWKQHIQRMEEGMIAMLSATTEDGVTIAEHDIAGVTVYEVVPDGLDETDRSVILDFHGGALILGGGEMCRAMSIGVAKRFGRRVWSVDYRMPPDHPYPAALDDGVAVYQALLEQRSASEIIITGSSAGGNLAAAVTLKVRDLGLPMPAGAILNTPEVDLTESGDSFNTNLGVDHVLAKLMTVNLLYADGHDLNDPYLSPLFGDFSKGFPPTVLTTGTRDLFLSNTVRMHRALRAADIRAELHVQEAAAHVGFPGSPEGALIDKELRLFIESVL